jgi:hypothetical protein
MRVEIWLALGHGLGVFQLIQRRLNRVDDIHDLPYWQVPGITGAEQSQTT